MCFRSDVRWEIHQENDPKKFMTVNCDEYVLAIPDYSSQARHLHNYAGRHMRPVVSPENQHEAVFKKVIVKLTGRVRWLAGLVFERDDEGGKRSFDFIPHYEVAFQTPQSVKHLFGQVRSGELGHEFWIFLFTRFRTTMLFGASEASTFTCR